MEPLRFEVELPLEILSLPGISRESLGRQAREWIVLELFREGRISSGKAAEVMGVSTGQFIDLLSRLEVPYLTATPTELADELASAEAARETRG